MSGITLAKQKAKKELAVTFLNVSFSLFSTFNLLFSATERIKLTAQPFPQFSGWVKRVGTQSHYSTSWIAP